MPSLVSLLFQEGGIGVARLKDNPDSEAKITDECADWIRLSSDDVQSSIDRKSVV